MFAYFWETEQYTRNANMVHDTQKSEIDFRRDFQSDFAKLWPAQAIEVRARRDQLDYPRFLYRKTERPHSNKRKPVSSKSRPNRLGLGRFVKLYRRFLQKRREALLFCHEKLYDTRFEKLLYAPNYEHQTSVKIIEWSLRALPQDAHDMVFVEFNAGRGERLLVASSQTFSGIVGSESCNILHDDAKMNIAQFPRYLMECRQIECICAPATKLAIPNTDTTFMFYKPSGLADFRLQIDRIVDAYRALPRRFYVLTVDAEPQHHELILDNGVFQVQKYSQVARLKHALFSPYRLRAYRTIA